jgi:hypothetical protein
MDDKPHRGENDIAQREVRISLMSSQGREEPLEVRCCDSGFDENLPPSKIFFLGGVTYLFCCTVADHTNVLL